MLYIFFKCYYWWKNHRDYNYIYTKVELLVPPNTKVLEITKHGREDIRKIKKFYENIYI